MIKAKSLRMGSFTEAETRALWLQHTEATGQVFAEDIFPELWADTRGQPWLVSRPSVRISNRIYQEVLPRELTLISVS